MTASPRKSIADNSSKRSRRTYKSFLGGLLTAGLLSATIVSDAQGREWTDNKGRKIEAEFVSEEGDKVVLDTNSKVYKVPLSSLSQPDQDFVKSQRDKAAGGTTEGALGDLRQWTDADGNTLQAKFVRATESMVYLQTKTAEKGIAFLRLSGADQNHVCQILVSRGDAKLASQLTALVSTSAGTPSPIPAAATPSLPPPDSAPGNVPNYPGASVPGATPIPSVGYTGVAQAPTGAPSIPSIPSVPQPMPYAAPPSQPAVPLNSSPIATPGMPSGSYPSSGYAPSPYASPAPYTSPTPYTSSGSDYSSSTDYSSDSDYSSSSSSSSTRSIRVTGRSIKGIIWLVLFVFGGLATLAKRLLGSSE